MVSTPWHHALRVFFLDFLSSALCCRSIIVRVMIVRYPRSNNTTGGSYLLLPGQACLGITRERIQLSTRLCGLLEGRSRFARLGLFVHITAG